MTDGPRENGLEQALAGTEADVEATLKAAAAVTTTLKKARAAARVGNLRDLRQTLASAEQNLAHLRQQLANARDGWEFDEDAYFGNGDFPRELLRTAERMNVRMFELDDRLYCYPTLVRVSPADRSVSIDRARERRIRPSVLVAQLRDLQRRPPRFKPEAFLEALASAYLALLERRGRDLFGQGAVIKLTEIYDLFTLLPGHSREYSRQEFARDLYLLDRSGVTTTRKGLVVSFPASTGTRAGSSAIRVITEDGREKLYYGIGFARPE